MQRAYRSLTCHNPVETEGRIQRTSEVASLELNHETRDRTVQCASIFDRDCRRSVGAL
jgi:hypothetical protein